MGRLISLLTTTLAAATLLLAPTTVAQAASVFDVGGGSLVAASRLAADTQAASNSDVQATTVATATVTQNHLPAWLQVVVASASLYTADTASDKVLIKLPRYTFLRVVSGGASRLQVQVYDENGNPSQAGWVDPNQVLPASAVTDWLVASTLTVLYVAADPSAQGVRNLERFTPLQKLDEPVQDRIRVRVYRSDFSGTVDQGWVDVSATGPALPPQTRVPAPTDNSLGLRSLGSAGYQQVFLDAAAQAAREETGFTGVPASVTVAQAILESDWGRSTLALNANNYFGMKATGTLGNDGLIYMPTSEFDADGQLYQTVSAFRAYKSMADSMMDHDLLLAQAQRYSAAMAARSDPRQFAALIQQAGYSTDPDYASKLVALMDRYDLYQLDA